MITSRIQTQQATLVRGMQPGFTSGAIPLFPFPSFLNIEDLGRLQYNTANFIISDPFLKIATTVNFFFSTSEGKIILSTETRIHAKSKLISYEPRTRSPKTTAKLI